MLNDLQGRSGEQSEDDYRGGNLLADRHDVDAREQSRRHENPGEQEQDADDEPGEEIQPPWVDPRAQDLAVVAQKQPEDARAGQQEPSQGEHPGGLAGVEPGQDPARARVVELDVVGRHKLHVGHIDQPVAKNVLAQQDLPGATLEPSQVDLLLRQYHPGLAELRDRLLETYTRRPPTLATTPVMSGYCYAAVA